ncbi:MAG TPA: PepSY-associated TM helix domain-containing protein [Alphaproteobacteria bacterium]|jgi:uncharacterized iron-regulated membrane protein
MPSKPSAFSNISPRVREILRITHIWIGIVICIPTAILGATGSILVYDQEILSLFSDSAPHVAAVGEQQSPEAIVAAAQAKAPGTRVTVLSLPAKPGELAVVRLQRPGAAPGPGGQQPVRVDPVSLEVLANNAAASPAWLRWTHSLHANMLISRDGRDYVGWLGVIMLALGVSGLVIWWPRPSRWRAAFGVERRAKGLMFHRQLHGAVGIWGLLVFIVVSFSGVYICFPQTTGAVVKTFFPGRELRSMAATVKVKPVEGGAPIGLNAATDLAKKTVPDAIVRSVFMPQRPDQPVRIGMTHGTHSTAQGVPVITVFVDPWRGEVVELLDPSRYTVGETIMSWQRALHAGAGAGWLFRFLVFLSGFMPVVFAITGIAMWLHKRRSKMRTTDAAPAE